MYSNLKRYYAYRGSDGYFRGHNLVTPSQLKTLAYYNSDQEFFTALEYYYPNGEVAGSVMAFDIDAEGDLGVALDVAREIARRLDSMGIKYNSYFSGSKGMHIVIPKMILGSKAYLTCRAIYRTFFDINHVDFHIYRTKSLFRVSGTVNKKSGLYKIPVDLNESLESMLKSAEEPRTIELSIDFDDSINLDELILKAKPLLATMSTSEPKTDTVYEYQRTPCLQRMWEETDPPRDDWHMMIYCMAKDSLGAGLDAEETIELFDNHDFWGSLCGYGYSRRSYTKIIRSLYNSGKFGLGCKSGGLTADLMLSRCSPLCWFNDEVSLMELMSNGKDGL